MEALPTKLCERLIYEIFSEFESLGNVARVGGLNAVIVVYGGLGEEQKDICGSTAIHWGALPTPYTNTNRKIKIDTQKENSRGYGSKLASEPKQNRTQIWTARRNGDAIRPVSTISLSSNS